MPDTCIGQKEVGWEWRGAFFKDEILRGIVQSNGLLIPKERVAKGTMQTAAWALDQKGIFIQYII